MKPDWTPAKANGIVGNPVYAINIAPALAKPHPLLVSEEQWIAANVKQIENLGPHEYPWEPTHNPEGQLSTRTPAPRT